MEPHGAAWNLMEPHGTAAHFRETAVFLRMKGTDAMEKPDYVKNVQLPEGTFLKRIGSHWYLYGRQSPIIDPETGRRKTVVGACLGRVEPDGLVPPMHRAGAGSGEAARTNMSGEQDGTGAQSSGRDAAPTPAAGQKRRFENCNLMPWYCWTWYDVEDEADKASRMEFERFCVTDEPEWLSAGPCVLVWSRTGALRKALRKHFPWYWKQIFAFALMRLVYGHNFVRQTEYYRTTLLPAMFPGLERHFPYLKYTDVLSELGRMRGEIAAFMREEMAGAASAGKDEKDAGLDGDSRLHSVRWLVCESVHPSIDYNDPDYSAEEYTRHPEDNEDYDPVEGKYRQWVFPRVLHVFDMKFPGCPRFYQARTLLPLGLDDLDAFLEESGLAPKDCVFVLDGSSLAGVEPAALEKKELRVVRVLEPGTSFDKEQFPSLTDNDDVFRARPLYPHEPPKIVAMREKVEDGWRMSSLFDMDWHRVDVNTILFREEFNRDAMRRMIDQELGRRERGEGRWSDDELKEAQDNLASCCRRQLAESTGDGIMEIASNLHDWTKRDLYRICLRFAKTAVLMAQLAAKMKECAWGVCDKRSEEGWSFVDHVTLLMEWAVLPWELRPLVEALDLSACDVFFRLRKSTNIQTRTGRIAPDNLRCWENSLLSRVLDFSARDMNIADFLAECRSEG